MCFLLTPGETDWSKTGISLFPEAQTHEMQPTIEDFHKHFDVVFLDPSGFHNVCAFLDRCSYHEVSAGFQCVSNLVVNFILMELSSLLQLRFEAHQALLCLDNHHSEAIEVLFTSQSPFLLRHDTYFTYVTAGPRLWAPWAELLHPCGWSSVFSYIAIVFRHVTWDLKCWAFDDVELQK